MTLLCWLCKLTVGGYSLATLSTMATVKAPFAKSLGAANMFCLCKHHNSKLNQCCFILCLTAKYGCSPYSFDEAAAGLLCLCTQCNTRIKFSINCYATIMTAALAVFLRQLQLRFSGGGGGGALQTPIGLYNKPDKYVEFTVTMPQIICFYIRDVSILHPHC